MARPVSENLREDMLEGCLRLFLQKNLGAVTIDDLILSSGCSRKYIYHYFKDKEDVFSAVTERFIQKLVDYHARFCGEDKISLLDYIIAYIDYMKNLSQYVKAMTGGKVSSHLYFMAQAAEYYPHFSESARKLFVQEQESWEKNLRMAIERKEVRPDIDVKLTAMKFRCINTGVGFQSVVQSEDGSLSTLQLLLIDLYNDIKLQSVSSPNIFKLL